MYWFGDEACRHSTKLLRVYEKLLHFSLFFCILRLILWHLLIESNSIADVPCVDQTSIFSFSSSFSFVRNDFFLIYEMESVANQRSILHFFSISLYHFFFFLLLFHYYYWSVCVCRIRKGNFSSKKGSNDWLCIQKSHFG